MLSNPYQHFSDKNISLCCNSCSGIEEILEVARNFFTESDLKNRSLQRIFANATKLKSQLSLERKQEILKSRFRDWHGWQRYKAEKTYCDLQNSPNHLKKDEPLWVSKATTSPSKFFFDTREEGKNFARQLGQQQLSFSLDESKKNLTLYGDRLVIAFHKIPCAYLQEGGCSFCNLSAMNIGITNVTPEHQLKAISTALQEADSRTTVVEILPDGSFLNPQEVPLVVQENAMKFISERSNVYRVAIETQPQYCSPQQIRSILAKLRPDQLLELYFGLETIDDWVNVVINNKGYVYQDFQQKIRKLAQELSLEEKKRLRITTYNFMKPSYLTEQEAFQATCTFVREIAIFSKEVGIPMEVKCEPSVVSEGTLQGYLYGQLNEQGKPRYEIMSYFTVAEVIAKLAEEGLEQWVKFGQCDDIDEFSEIAMIPSINDNTHFAEINFVVYHAVQNFNIQKNLRDFIVYMSLAIKSDEFIHWEKQLYKTTSQRSTLYTITKRALHKNPFSKEEQKLIEHQKNILLALKKLEYNENIIKTMLKSNTKNIQLTTHVKNIFQQHNINLLAVTNISVNTFLRTGYNENFLTQGVQFEVVVETENHPQHIWSRIAIE